MEPVSKHSVLLLDNLTVFDDVVVPGLDSMCIMDTLVADTHDLKTTPFELAGVPVHRAGGIGTREDVLAHEVAPDEVFVGPVAAETRNLQEKDTIGFQESLHLGHVSLVVADTDVLTHLEAGNLVVLTPLVSGKLSVIEQVNLDLSFQFFLLDSAGAPLELARGDSHTGALDIEVLGDIDDP